MKSQLLTGNKSIKQKGKVFPVHNTKAYRGRQRNNSTHSFLTSALDEAERITSPPQKKTWYQKG
jgi:hypothetical protein